MISPVIRLRTLPPNTWREYPGRIIRLGVLHHTGPSTPDPVPTTKGSWERTFCRDGSITVWTDDSSLATFHTLNTIRWRPPSVSACPDGMVSDANYSSRGYEIVTSPDDGQAPTIEQLTSLRWQAAFDLQRDGQVPWVGHGQIDSTKRESEPTGLDWKAIGYDWHPGIGYLWSPQEEYVDWISEDDFKTYLEIYDHGANPATALFQRALLAYRRGENRGPLLSGEYPYTHPATDTEPERNTIRQDFTGQTLEFDPATGGLSWVENNLEASRPT